MQQKTNKRLKLIAAAFAIVFAIIAITFAVAQYEKYKKDEVTLSFFEYRIKPEEGEVVVTPITYTREGVKVELSSEDLIAGNKDKTDEKDMLVIQYQFGNKEDLKADGWIEYTGPFSVSENTKIFARLYSEQSHKELSFYGPLTEIDIKHCCCQNWRQVF